MRKLYTCIDIGSHSTKLVIAEKLEDKFVVLSRFIVRSKGIQNGVIVHEDDALIAIKKAISQAEADLGIHIQEVLCLIPSMNAEFAMVDAEIEVDGEIGNSEITKVLQESVLGKIDDDHALVNLSPIFYQVDGGERLKDVREYSGHTLSVKAIASVVPKSFLRPFFNLFKRMSLTITDIGFGIVGDYHAMREKAFDSNAIAVVNIGYDKTDVGVFNKGILVQSGSFEKGSKFVDIDISQIFQIEKKKARYLKETFAVSNTRYANVEDVLTLTDRNGIEIQINQLKISEVVEERVQEILKLAKKQISVLTNREIRYIIVTGGISELAGFQYVLENVFGRVANVLSMDKMGVRSNSYSSCVGFIEYFDEKMELRDKAYSMISEDLLEVVEKKKKTSGENGLGNFLNYLTGNKED